MKFNIKSTKRDRDTVKSGEKNLKYVGLCAETK